MGRSYSKELDTVLDTWVNKENSMVTTQNSIFIGLLKMLVRNRIDYTLGYSHEMTYVSKDLKLKEKFLSLPITDANSLIPVYVGCPKNEWGRKIIKKLNPYLKLNRENIAYYGVYLQWLDPKAAQEYPLLVKEYFGKK